MSSLAGRKIALLEDEYLIALDAEQILAELGAKVVIATNLEEADKLATAGGFDAAVLDVNINGEFSFPIAEKFRQCGTPVVFASGYELKARRFPGADLGVCISKPYTAERLRQAVADALAGVKEGSPK